MARTNKTTKTTKATRTTKPSNKSRKPTKLNFFQRKLDTKLVVFILIFAALGTYLLVRSRANPGISFKLARDAVNLTTGNGSPRVVRETTGNKRDADVVLVDAGQNQTNYVYVKYPNAVAGSYKVCGFGRKNNGGTAQLVAADQPFNSVVKPNSTISIAYPSTTGTDYKYVCTTLDLNKTGTVYISNVVNSGTWNFSINTIELLKEYPQPPETNTTFPTPETTGWKPTGVTLTPYTGPCEITRDGTVIDGKDIKCRLTINASNVRISQSRIIGGSGHIITVRSGDGLTIVDSEITSNSPGDDGRALAMWGGSNITLKRVYIHNVLRGIEPGNGLTLENSYIGDMNNPTDSHTTAIGVNGGSKNVVLRGNTLTCDTNHCSSAISAYPEVGMGGPNSNWTVEGNLLNTTGQYCMYMGYTPSAGERPNNNMKITNNTFGNRFNARCGGQSYVSWSNESVGVTPNSNSNVFSGNVDGSGKPITL